MLKEISQQVYDDINSLIYPSNFGYYDEEQDKYFYDEIYIGRYLQATPPIDIESIYFNHTGNLLSDQTIDTISTLSYNIACCPFGGKSDQEGKFLVANGRSMDKDENSRHKTRQPIAVPGKLVGIAYKTQEADTTTRIKIHINGVVESSILLSSINSDHCGMEELDIMVKNGDYVEIEYDSGTAPGECTMYFMQEI